MVTLASGGGGGSGAAFALQPANIRAHPNIKEATGALPANFSAADLLLSLIL